MKFCMSDPDATAKMLFFPWVNKHQGCLWTDVFARFPRGWACADSSDEMLKGHVTALMDLYFQERRERAA